LSASNLTAERIESYALFLKQFRPKLIYGYATVIYRVAMHLLENPGELGSFRPRLIACTAEMLMPKMREMIVEAFGCPVANEYGSRDGGLIAHECPTGNLHILGEHVIVEIDQPDHEGIGDLLVTNLDAYSMPFIRYRIGDRGALSDKKCACGLPLPLLKGLKGRSNDFMVGNKNRIVHNSSADYVLRNNGAFHQYQLVQRPDHSFDLYVVLNRSLTNNEEVAIRQGLCKILDENIDVRFHPREIIPPEQSGKYRWLISEARPDATA
jgi:phenylacetate-CoA ligase